MELFTACDIPAAIAEYAVFNGQAIVIVEHFDRPTAPR